MRLTPFVHELRDDYLLGYLRITVKDGSLTSDLSNAFKHYSQLLGIGLILSVIVGFLLAHGLNRLNRQGFRLPTK